MADQTVEIDLSLQVEGPEGAQGAVKLSDLQKADPSAGPGALESTQAGVRTAVQGMLAAMGAPAPLPAGAATEATLLAMSAKLPAKNVDGGALAHVTNFPATQTVDGTVDLADRIGRLLGHVTVDNPPDLSALSTAARQDAQTAQLTTLAGVDYATGADVAVLAAKLDTVATNTADIKLDADHLSIEADAINLNTDGVEARLDTLSAKDYATQATLAQVKARADLLATEATVAALSGKLPAALVGGRLDVNLGASGVTLQTDPSDRVGRLLGVVTGPLTDAQLRATAVPVSQSGAWTTSSPAVAAGNLRKVTVAAGTAVRLSAGTLPVRRAVVAALETNVGRVVIGGAAVVAAVGTRNSPPLLALDSIELGAVDLTNVYLDSTVSGEGVTVLYEA